MDDVLASRMSRFRHDPLSSLVEQQCNRQGQQRRDVPGEQELRVQRPRVSRTPRRTSPPRSRTCQSRQSSQPAAGSRAACRPAATSVSPLKMRSARRRSIHLTRWGRPFRFQARSTRLPRGPGRSITAQAGCCERSSFTRLRQQKTPRGLPSGPWRLHASQQAARAAKNRRHYRGLDPSGTTTRSAKNRSFYAVLCMAAGLPALTCNRIPWRYTRAPPVMRQMAVFMTKPLLRVVAGADFPAGEIYRHAHHLRRELNEAAVGVRAAESHLADAAHLHLAGALDGPCRLGSGHVKV